MFEAHCDEKSSVLKRLDKNAVLLRLEAQKGDAQVGAP